MNELTPSRPFKIGSWLWVSILPLVAGILLSLLIPRPVVGVIYLNDAIYSNSAKDLITQIRYARQQPEVRAVVIVLDSPGGTVSDTESVYLELARLRETKPVVTMIEAMAASGAYYMAVGSDYILAKPSSSVGNVGVIGYLPSSPQVEEEIYSTGPYKMWGTARDTFVREMEMLKEGFLQAVLLGRAEALKASAEDIQSGQIWPGSEALRLGLIDEMGSQSRAFEKAAQMAHVAHYEVKDLRPLAGLPDYTSYPFFYQTAEGMTTPYPKEPGLYLLYIPPMER